MQEKVKKLQETANEIVLVSENFPRKETVLFDKWSLKDIIAHLNNWITHDISCIESVLNNTNEPAWEPDVDEFNAKGVEERKSDSWESILSEFEYLSEQLIDSYKELAEEDWNKKIWQDKHHTPATFLEEDINHWSLHLKEIHSI